MGKRQHSKDQRSCKRIQSDVEPTDKAAAVNFMTYGVSDATISLGYGERLALVRDQLQTLGRIDIPALEQLANGQKPTARNLAKEQAERPRRLYAFQQIAGHDPNFKNTKDDLAWNAIMYRIRFPRDLAKETTGLAKFQAVFHRVPSGPLGWAVVRAWGYVLNPKVPAPQTPASAVAAPVTISETTPSASNATASTEIQRLS